MFESEFKTTKKIYGNVQKTRSIELKLLISPKSHSIVQQNITLNQQIRSVGGRQMPTPGAEYRRTIACERGGPRALI